jgi:hypothetical protein
VALRSHYRVSTHSIASPASGHAREGRGGGEDGAPPIPFRQGIREGIAPLAGPRGNTYQTIRRVVPLLDAGDTTIVLGLGGLGYLVIQSRGPRAIELSSGSTSWSRCAGWPAR